MNAVDRRRRHFVLGSALGAGALLLPWRGASAAARTAAFTEGPFYPAEIPLDHDNDLVRVEGGTESAIGDVADVWGRVLDERGRAFAGVRVEIWQCDANGRYHHPRDSNEAPLDRAFQGYGAATTNADGAYRFRTIRPVAYPGRTPHIHFRLAGAGVQPLTTQLFVADDPGNAADGLYRSLEPALRETVTVPFVRERAGYSARFDLVLAAAVRPA
ncbi:MAG TPA: protocatechuate 3,4-dioxygenase [Candidatus Saccharimonadia bacterium]|nr:protocatechuate 3,4-dioxygenase [Candidatus Saccharimonadia bacterium]